MTVAEGNPFDTGFSHLITGGTGQKIPVKPVDALEFGQPGFIKIDAEGMELDILAGATHTLARARPFVLIENFLEFEAPEKTYEPMDFLYKNDYRTFVPVLEFRRNDRSVLLNYGRDYTPCIELHGQPQLGVVEISARRRFLLGNQLNLLGVHAACVDELWKLGISDLGKM